MSFFKCCQKLSQLCCGSFSKVNSSTKKINVLTAFDSFKDSLPAHDVGTHVFQGLQNAFPNVLLEHKNIPLSDGGDGFIECLLPVLPSSEVELHYKTVTGPFPYVSETKTQYLIWKKKKLAIIELALTSGLEMVPLNSRNPYNTTTYGLGELIMEIYEKKKIKHILLGVGGSSTNDAGLGALQRMGMTFLPQKKSILIGEDLLHITKLNELKNEKLIPQLNIDIACDVDNPFCGENGAPMIYGKQKGMNEKQQKEMDESMKKMIKLFKDATGRDISKLKGAGAAGGIPGGFYAFQKARLKPGIELIDEYVKLEENIKNCDVVFTGEGKYDSQTKHGKVCSHVESLCKKHGKPSIVICGKNEVEGKKNVYDLVSKFGFEKSMKDTKECVVSVVQENCHKFPVFCKLKVK